MIFSLTPPIKGLILDMDGVLWKDTDPIGDLPSLFKTLRDHQIRVAFATNNATRDVSEVVKKILGFGVEVEPWQVITSGIAVSYLLKKHFPNGAKVYVLGEPSLISTLQENGFDHSDQEDVEAVVVGLDRKVTYEKINKAAGLIRGGLLFIGTNPDTTYPTPSGLQPGAGTIIAAVQAASNVIPILAGKPETAMFEMALERLGAGASETLAIGDRLDTDIVGGFRAGCRTGLVLTGISSFEEARAFTPPPDLIANSLTEMVG